MKINHNQECKMAFGRKDPECPRCQELLSGEPARSGWQKDYFSRKKINDERRLKEIKDHDCKKSNCSIICTFGDY